MPQITMYVTPVCPYCQRAKGLLQRKGVDLGTVTLIDIATDTGKQEEMIEKAGGRRTVPQIFIGARHIGGFDDLHALDQQGELDALLAA